jgi:hypothetical protein
MEIQYTPRFLKLMSKIKDKRGRIETDKIIDKIKNANDFSELNQVLDIKKYVVGGYRIRYSGKPEMRIRFSLIPDQEGNEKKVVELRWVGNREEYERISNKPLNESVKKKMVIIVSESQFQRLMLK